MKYYIIKKAAAITAAGAVCMLNAGYLPVYADSSDEAAFLGSAISAENVTVYDGSDSSNTFTMMGKDYSQGLVLSDKGYYDGCSISFSAEGLTSVSFSLGHIDNSGIDGASLNIYLDDTLVETLECTYKMPVMEHTVTTYNAASITFELVDPANSGYNDACYGMGNIYLDDDSSGIIDDSPVYENAASFMNSAFDNRGEKVAVYDGSKGYNQYVMMGRTYTQGFVLSDEGYYDTCGMSFNTENVDSISFTLGHLDNSGIDGANLNVYHDNTLVESIECSYTMPVQEVTINTSDSDMIRFELVDPANSGWNDACYCMGNVYINGDSESLVTDDVTYENAAAFINSAFDNIEAKVTSYDGSKSYNQYVMMGRTYTQGLVLSDDGYYDTCAVSFNTENVESISFTLGHLDNSGVDGASLKVYHDNVPIETIECKYTMVPQDVTIDTADASIVRFEIADPANSGWNDACYCMANIFINGNSEELVTESVTYEDTADFLNSSFDNINGKITIYDGTDPLIGFDMGENTYIQGMVLSDSGYYNTCGISWNVENISSMVFTLGHADADGRDGASLRIYKDDVLEYEVDCKAKMENRYFWFDCSDTSRLRIELADPANSGWNDAVYALSNIVLNDSIDALTEFGYEADSVMDLDWYMLQKKLGDVDETGSVNIDDASLILTCYASKAASLDFAFDTEDEELNAKLNDYADIDRDGDITINDASLALTYYAAKAAGLGITWDDLVEMPSPLADLDL